MGRGIISSSKSIEEKGESGLEEEETCLCWYHQGKKNCKNFFSMNRFYLGDWVDSTASRFVDELPDEFIKKNNNFVEEKDDEFDFNQDINFDNEIRSPGWLRYQKKLK